MDFEFEVEDSENYKASWLRLVGSIALGVIIIFLLCWLAAPIASFIIGSFISIMKGTQPEIEVSPIMLAIDYALSFLFVMFGCFIAIKTSKSNPFHVAIPIGIIGWLIYFTEVGGFPGMLESSYSLWYEIPSFLQDIVATTLTAIIFMKTTGSGTGN